MTNAVGIGFALPLLVVAVIAAIVLAVLAFARPGARIALGVAVGLLALAFLLLVGFRSSREPSLPREVTFAYADTGSPPTPRARLRLDTGELAIRSEFLDPLLPADVYALAPPEIDADDTRTARAKIIASVEHYLKELMQGQRTTTSESVELRTLLTRLKSAEIRALATEITKRAEIEHQVQTGALTTPSAGQHKEYRLHLGGERERLLELAGLSDAYSAQPQRMGLIPRVLILVGTIVVAAAVLRAVSRRAQERSAAPPPRVL